MASWIYKQVLRLALRWSTFVVAVSEFAKIRLAKEVFLREVIMIPNGVRTRDVKGQGVPRVCSPDGVLRLITVGSVTGRKGQANVVRALPELRKYFGAIEYHLVGEPSEAPQVRALAKSLDVESHLFVHGVLTDVARDDLLTRMDVCVMLSENRPDGDVEGFGIAVLEANLLGIPAIGSRGTGLEQSIVEGKSGLLIDPKSYNELAHALQTVLYSYSGYSLGAIAWAGAHSWDTIGRHYRELID
jgi:glycosyltransferase involved in cell wall biosynthesis